MSLSKFFVVVSMLSAYASASVLLGVTPSYLQFDSLLPGSVVNTSVFITQNLDDGMELNIENIGLEGWIQYGRISEDGHLKLSFTIPEDAVVGEYEGRMLLSVVHDGREQIGTVVQVPLKISLRVTDQAVSKHDVLSVKIPNYSRDPELMITVFNSGNQAVSISPISYSIKDSLKNELGVEGEVKIKNDLKPMQRKTFTYPIPLSLEPGQYWSELIFSIDGDDYAYLVPFDVVGTGTVNSKVIGFIRGVWDIFF